MKRGQRLVFSNGIIVLTVLSVTLIGVVGANVNALVPFYAIGCSPPSRWPGSAWRSTSARTGTRLAAKAGHLLLVRGAHLDRGRDLRGGEVHLGCLADSDHLPGRGVRADQAQPAYRAEAGALQTIGDRRAPGRAPASRTRRRVVIIFVDDFDLSRIAAIRYAKGLRPTTMRAVHFVIDTEQGEAPAGLAARQERVARVRGHPGPQADPGRRQLMSRRRPRPAPR